MVDIVGNDPLRCKKVKDAQVHLLRCFVRGKKATSIDDARCALLGQPTVYKIYIEKLKDPSNHKSTESNQ